jgi:hypothetical protein
MDLSVKHTPIASDIKLDPDCFLKELQLLSLCREVTKHEFSKKTWSINSTVSNKLPDSIHTGQQAVYSQTWLGYNVKLSARLFPGSC